MNYVMSDIHGEYDKFLEMLDKIDFQDEDTLYILGNVIDFGEEPIEVLTEMADRPNIYPIIGDCEQTAVDALTMLSEDISGGEVDKLRPETIQALTEWRLRGGAKTIEEFVRLTNEEKQDILDYLSDFSKFEVVDIEDKTYILVHRGLGDFENKGKKLKNYTVVDLAFTDVSYEKKYFDDDSVFIVSGHVPTYRLCGEDKIYKSNNNICINCGISERRRLACLCLETMQEFYV